MSRPSLTLTSGKESEFEFDVSIEGIPAEQASVRFVMESQTYDTAINCVRSARNSGKWLAKIPALRLDEVQSFRVEVVAAGYYFCPTSGSIKVTPSPKVSIAEMAFREDQIAVSAVFAQAESKPELVMLENMLPEDRANLTERCRSASRIFSKAASVMEQHKSTPHGLAATLEAVKKGIKMVEAKIYL